MQLAMQLTRLRKLAVVLLRSAEALVKRRDLSTTLFEPPEQRPLKSSQAVRA
jgi:hypothetical protein